MSKEGNKDYFRYPDGSRMCVAGQRRAALEAMELQFPKNGGQVHKGILSRAIRAITHLARGASVNKHDLISLQVLEAYTRGELEQYIDPETGDYKLRTYDGREFDVNAFDDLVDGKNTY